MKKQTRQGRVLENMTCLATIIQGRACCCCDKCALVLRLSYLFAAVKNEDGLTCHRLPS